MRCVVGIDQSAQHTGICVLNEEKVPKKTLLVSPPRHLKEEKRLAYIRDAVVACLAPFDLHTVTMEDYSFNSVNKKFLLGEIGSIIKIAAHDKNAVLFKVAPKQLKKFVTGRGDADKSKVMECLDKQWNLKFTDDNLADAAGLALIAHEIVWPMSCIRHQIAIANAVQNKDLKRKPKKRIKTVRDSI